ncbi:non-homologous end-joining DNA ligase [Nocardia terpenica]|uniref:non-homologous end-joining DNA ligase n=1 Tax=Nocardia terpenica TaxID=455432 RepID=UPI001894AE47|nr:non-homologous end-joining DNA ligase [Nocardia terpenica]MBF6059441.1 non-homologous end-joining DNA ligase [Nocardia terpenica]MBF6103020.1 non-homologous end-joining DNA ligase [Nocardia terpenica]MBF6110791.1 non-homologous end-joining DNA ligase [Nocardia terpenica]MBF6116922.1 non-homologous end-joining DNA ligase [Nocardia terpenica]MBF6151240.1 non-homologous end-joining DNA ligase [Nocardia terpenica]
MSTTVDIDTDGKTVRISNPDKVYFPTRGETKLDLVRYYQAVAEPFLRTVRDRPVLLERYPDGAGGKSWFQKRVPKSVPDWLQTTVVSTPNGTQSDALVAADLAHILWAVNLGCLGFHVWPNHVGSLDIADELRIDLDPSPGIGFDELRAAAVLVRQLCAELGIDARVKTSGSRGLHLYVLLEPRWDGYQVRAASVALARELERRHPDLITAQWWKEERGRRVFVDYNQNAPHRTVFGAWCVRPKVGGQVSTPLAWDELDAVAPDDLTLATVPTRVTTLGDPWADRTPQSIEPLLAMSQRDMDSGLMDAPWPPVYPKMPNEPPRVQPSKARKH